MAADSRHISNPGTRRFLTALTLSALACLAACGGGGGSAATSGSPATPSTAPSTSSANANGNAPAPIALTAAVASPTRVAMSWSNSTPASGDQYDVYRNGVLESSTSQQTTNTADTGLSPGQEYCYQVTAVNAAGAGMANSNQSCTTTAPLAGWNQSRVDQAPPLSLALDSAGLEHLSYCSPAGVTYQVRQANGSWTTNLIAPGASCFNAPIAMGSDGSAHIVYVDAHGNALEYASNASGRWVSTTVPGGSGAQFYSLALDSANHAHIAYLLFTGQSSGYYQIVYASDASGNWQSTVVASELAYPAIAVDGNGHAAIAYVSVAGSNSHALHYWSNAGGPWQDSIAAQSGDAKSLAALALSTDGTAHIIYKDGAILDYLSNAGGGWKSVQVDSFNTDGSYDNSAGAYDVSIALDSNRQAHFSYEDTDGNLKYASQQAAGWQLAYVDTEGTENELGVDAAGHAHIAYANRENLYSKLAVSP